MNTSNAQQIFRALSVVLFVVMCGSHLSADEPKPGATEQNLDAFLRGVPRLDISGGLTGQINFLAGREDAQRQCLLVYPAFATRSESWIGVDTAPLGDVLRSHLELDEGKGLVVSAVADNSPAAAAGIKPNDVLISVADVEIIDVATLEKLLKERAGTATPVNLMRAGKKQRFDVIPKSPNTGVEVAWKDAAAIRLEPRFWLGTGVAAADDTLRSHLGIAAGEGLVVTQVEESSPASKAGVMVNDLLLKLNGKPLTSVEALVAQLQEIADKSVSLELLRHGKPAMLTVTPEKRELARVQLDYTTNLGFQEGTATAQLVFTNVIFDQMIRSQIIDDSVNQPKPDVAKQTGDLIEQVKQLQKSLEGLEAAIKSLPQNPTTGGDKK